MNKLKQIAKILFVAAAAVCVASPCLAQSTGQIVVADAAVAGQPVQRGAWDPALLTEAAPAPVGVSSGGNPSPGALHFNPQTRAMEFFNGTQWLALVSTSAGGR